jgi:hypothetical protein
VIAMRRPSTLPALCAVLLVVGQLVALAHQAETRHVTCAEHGESLEAATLAESLHACGDDHLVGVDGSGGEHHDDCLVLRALHQSSAAPGTWLPPLVAAAELVSDPVPHVAASSLAWSIFRLAPKTSPPCLS